MTTLVLKIATNKYFSSMYDQFINNNYDHIEAILNATACFLTNSRLLDRKFTSDRIMNENHKLTDSINLISTNPALIQVEIINIDLIELHTVVNQLNESYPESTSLYEIKESKIM